MLCIPIRDTRGIPTFKNPCHLWRGGSRWQQVTSMGRCCSSLGEQRGALASPYVPKPCVTCPGAKPLSCVWSCMFSGSNSLLPEDVQTLKFKGKSPLKGVKSLTCFARALLWPASKPPYAPGDTVTSSQRLFLSSGSEWG